MYNVNTSLWLPNLRWRIYLSTDWQCHTMNGTILASFFICIYKIKIGVLPISCRWEPKRVLFYQLTAQWSESLDLNMYKGKTTQLYCQMPIAVHKQTRNQTHSCRHITANAVHAKVNPSMCNVHCVCVCECKVKMSPKNH